MEHGGHGDSRDSPDESPLEDKLRDAYPTQPKVGQQLGLVDARRLSSFC